MLIIAFCQALGCLGCKAILCLRDVYHSPLCYFLALSMVYWPGWHDHPAPMMCADVTCLQRKPVTHPRYAFHPCTEIVEGLQISHPGFHLAYMRHWNRSHACVHRSHSWLLAVCVIAGTHAYAVTSRVCYLQILNSFCACTGRSAGVCWASSAYTSHLHTHIIGTVPSYHTGQTA